MADDLELLIKRVRAEILGRMPDWPGGWKGQAEAAIIDAVCSIRARYGGPESGVRRQVKDWRDHRGGKPVDDLRALVSFAEWNSQRSKPLGSKVRGHLKAEVISDVASRFVADGITSAKELLSSARAEDIWMSTPGLGYVTWRYLLLLLGRSTVKPDTMLTRWVAAAVGHAVTPRDVTRLVTACAKEVDVPAHLLDHAIWQAQRRTR